MIQYRNFEQAVLFMKLDLCKILMSLQLILGGLQQKKY